MAKQEVDILNIKIKKIDILDIKLANYLRFYVEDNYIYCENLETEEKIIVGEVINDGW